MIVKTHFSTQPIKHQTDSDSLINTMINHLLNENHSLDKFHERKISDAEKFNNEVINVSTPTEFDSSSETEISANRTYSAAH